MPTSYHFFEQHDRHPNETGISLASRWPFVRTDELDLHVTSRTGDFPCSALFAEIHAPGPLGSVVLVNPLPSWQLDFEYERELQAVAVARHIAEFAQPSAHVIVAGDLDADAQATSVRFWTGYAAIDGMSVCYRDAWESAHPHDAGHTFSGSNPLVALAAPDWPFRRVDYILVRCAEHAGATLEIERTELVFEQAVKGVWASDHFGVMADLRVR